MFSGRARNWVRIKHSISIIVKVIFTEKTKASVQDVFRFGLGYWLGLGYS
jgi:hypothetical protein